MDKKTLASYIDNTLLKQNATLDDILKFVDDSVPYDFASLCISPYAIKAVRQHLGANKTKIATVIGFPNGTHSTKSKVYETEVALEDGADEIDFVINMGMLRNGDYSYVGNEIAELKKVCGSHILKCIIETCMLTESEKIKMCNLIEENGGDFVKTSTGFGGGGATESDIKLIKANIKNPNTKIKASGGIRTLQDTLKMIECGANRIGTSGGCKIVDELQ